MRAEQRPAPVGVTLQSVVPTPLPSVRLAVDCMGGDQGATVTLPACRAFLAKHPHVELVLVGTAPALEAFRDLPRCTMAVATEVVTMDDSVEVALRKKRDSSMRIAIQQVKDGAHACVSAGNTGALMAVARYLLKTLEGIDRPAIATVMPNRNDGYTTVLDLGANVDCTPEHLLQFAVMGSALVSAVEGKEEPVVGLLNIGEEAIKGSDTIKRAGELLRAAGEGGHIRFHGNVEGNDIFKGTADVVVCDGFVGNVTLKAVEGVSRFFKASLMESTLSKLGALLAMKSLKKLNPESYNGAGLLGLKGLVFKSHGSANAYAYEWAIRRAYNAAKYNVQEQLHTLIAEMLPQAPAAETPGSTIQQG